MASRQWGCPLLQGDTSLTSTSFPNLISRGLPVFTSTGTAANATSSNYNNILTLTATSGTIALDISGVAVAQKTTNALYWYDETGVDTTTLYFDVGNATGGGGVKNNQPAAYTLEGNTGAGGGSPPGSGWVTLATIANGLASRKHVLSGASSLAGYNWVRMNISSSSSSAISLKLDLWDISRGNKDILQLADSRGWFGNTHKNPHGGSVVCDSLGNQMQSTLGYYVPTINAGMSGAKAADIDALVNGWLTTLGSFYAVTMEIGINDATASPWSSGWTTSVQSIVNKCLAAGITKFFLETIGDSTSAGVHTNILSGYLTAIAGIISGTPGCFAGYDTYTYLNANPGLISGDLIHETDQGFVNVLTNKAVFYPSRL